MFKGKTAIVTGAGSGIGQAVAIELAKENCNLALIDIDGEGLQYTAEMLSGEIIVSTHIADVSDKAQTSELPEKVFAVHEKADFLFNIAGVAAGGDFEALPVDIFENAMRINFFSQVYMMKAFWNNLKKAPKAYVVNMASVTGKAAFAKNSAYSASKFAVAGFTNSVAFELENSNIKFSVIYPGAVCTNIHANAISFGGDGDPNAPYMISQGISPRKVAEAVIKGVRKGKREIVVGKDARLLLLMQKFLPIRYWSIIKRYVKKVEE